MRLDIAGLRVRVDATGPINPHNLAVRFGQYAAPDDLRADDLHLQVTVDPAWAPPHPVRNRYPGVDFARDPDGALRFLRPDGETIVRLGQHRAAAVTQPTIVTDDPMEDITPIDTPLRLQLASELPAHDGAMVHACGYADERGAVLFIARSGGGKTTTARKLPDAHVLSDDLVAVRRTADGWDAHALPFVGEWRRPTVPRRGRLRALVFLRKSDDLSVSVCPPSLAFPDMLQAMVWFAKGDPAAAALLDHAHDLIGAVPCVALAIPRELPVMPLIDRWLA
ncbi:MAG: hypothetical protein Q8S73_42350 [Deltaproteobacteria bacterium]|nr:hypothetical protein [Myxococcales bacterium]MDP3220803.1 hypothetical protein [Deltaproteobacteria bacterium]